jgi:hypothetical protein
VQGNFLADRQTLAEYQATMPHLVFDENRTPARPHAPLMLNDRQDVANYQLFLSHGYSE